MNKRDTLATTRTLILPSGRAVPFSSAQFATRHRAHFEHHWVVRWQVPPGTHHVQETLPHPLAHICVETGRHARRGAYVQGVVGQRFVRRLAGSGRVFGTKLAPGALWTLGRVPHAALRDRRVPLAELVGAATARAFAAVATDERAGDDACARAVDDLWADRLPPPDDGITLVRRIVAAIESDRTLLRVEDVVARFAISARELQRAFRLAVGLPPKLVIRRARLQEALLHLAGGADVTTVAHELGYADASHFSRDLKAVVGVSPSRYRQGWTAARR